MKTNDLTGTALDWVVAKCEYPNLVWGETIGIHHASHQIVIPEFDEPDCYYNPSTDWAQGGLIIERERIRLDTSWVDDCDEAHNSWTARIDTVGGWWAGETPLVAAMRCYVASKFGEELDIPEELT